MNETLSPAAIEARREYKREYMKRWRAKNPEKVKANNNRYWENRARRAAENGKNSD